MPKLVANTVAAMLIAWFPIGLMSGSSLISLILFSPFALAILLPLVIIISNQRYPGIKLSKAASWYEILFFVLWFLVGLSLMMGVRADTSVWALPESILSRFGVYYSHDWGEVVFLGMIAISLILAFAVSFQVHADKRRLGNPKELK